MATATSKANAAKFPPSKSKRDSTVEVNIHPNWVQLIRYCGTYHQAGLLSIRVEGSIPVKRLIPGTKKDIRFGKNPIPALFFKETNTTTVNCRVTRNWNNMIWFCKHKIPYGQVCITVARGEPNKFVEEFSAHDINFAHPETFPEEFAIFNELGS